MHGVKRETLTEEQIAQKRAIEKGKVQQYNTRVQSFQNLKAAGLQNQDVLDISKSLLSVNTEYYTIWNYRRLTLASLIVEEPEKAVELLKDELVFNTACIKVNPKVYCIWFHREWVASELDKRKCMSWSTELALCSKLHDVDDRNFHCWRYRTFCCANSGVTDTEHLEYTCTRIDQNFSNYSAWHLRSKVLPKLVKETLSTKEAYPILLQSQRAKVPGFIYDGLSTGVGSTVLEKEDWQRIIEGVLETCEQLREDDETLKWPCLTSVHLWSTLTEHGHSGLAPLITEMLDTLKSLDKGHASYYDFLRPKV